MVLRYKCSRQSVRCLRNVASISQKCHFRKNIRRISEATVNHSSRLSLYMDTLDRNSAANRGKLRETFFHYT